MLRGFSIGLVLFATINAVFGLLKLQTEIDAHGKVSNLLVDPSLAKDDFVYLFQFPRTSTTPSQAALNLFIETAIKFMGIKFRRISNQFFLGSHSAGAAPFIQYQGKYIDGSENVLKKLREIHQKMHQKREEGTSQIQGLLEHPQKEEEAKIRDFAENILFKILMKDRATRNPDGNGGLDFMIADEGIVEQMMPVMPAVLLRANPNGLSLALAEDHTVTVAVQKPEFWKAFFQLRKISEKVKEWKRLNEEFNVFRDQGVRLQMEGLLLDSAKLHDHLEEFVTGFKADDDFVNRAYGISSEDWELFEEKMNEFVAAQLKRQFTDLGNPQSSEKKLQAFLKEHHFTLDGKKLSYWEATEDEIYKFFEMELKKLNLEALLRKRQFLFGAKPSAADASLFGILVQFFETPLNMAKFNAFFKWHNFDVHMNILKNHLQSFMGRVREHLKLPYQKWEALKKRPWQLNYEDDEPRNFGDKYDGPYNIEMGELKGFELLLAVNSVANSKAINDEIGASISQNQSKAMGIKRDLLVVVVTAVLDHCKGQPIIQQKVALLETAAYLCNVGKEKSPDEGKQCRVEHDKRVDQRQRETIDGYALKIQETRKVVYRTIVDFMDTVVGRNVVEATLDVARMVVQARNTNAAKALVSADAVGNEQ